MFVVNFYLQTEHISAMDFKSDIGELSLTGNYELVDGHRGNPVHKHNNTIALVDKDSSDDD